MYETRNVRPYYTVPHLGVFGQRLKELVGFEYKYSIYITSRAMNNSAYHEVGEMLLAGRHFAKLWNNNKKTRSLIKDIKNSFKEAVKAEKYGWRQNWLKKTEAELLADMNFFYNLLFKVFTRMIISQPQHVIPLDRQITSLLDKYPDKDELIIAATTFSGQLPWASEDKEIKKIHKTWPSLALRERNLILDKLVVKYGWFNDIEGDQPFNRDHYRQKIINFKEEVKRPLALSLPLKVRKVGRLIGELGFLRFWNRYHFMTLRYLLKKILTELTKRSGQKDLEWATVSEINDYFKKKKIDWSEIRGRRKGYASYLAKREAVIVTGSRAVKLKALVKEDISHIKEVSGVVANKGRVIGRVRIISFTAKDYNKQVALFKDREILVTGMTRPQIVHLCKKAAAIVTDEGGITSHAAVVGRELGIPCIIATHNATKILKTGDLVEVDANQGLVRKINNK